MTPRRKSRKVKIEPREYWMVESEYGMDFKRYMTNVLRTEAEALAFQNYLILKNPYDKHEVIRLREVLPGGLKKRGRR